MSSLNVTEQVCTVQINQWANLSVEHQSWQFENFYCTAAAHSDFTVSAHEGWPKENFRLPTLLPWSILSCDCSEWTVKVRRSAAIFYPFFDESDRGRSARTVAGGGAVWRNGDALAKKSVPDDGILQTPLFSSFLNWVFNVLSMQVWLSINPFRISKGAYYDWWLVHQITTFLSPRNQHHYC